MAWTTVNIGGGQNSNPSGTMAPGTKTWATTRQMLGQVQMRLTDVTLSSGERFRDTPPGSLIRVQLMLANGNPYSSGFVGLPKKWGVTPGWTNVGFVTGPRRGIRLRTNADLVKQHANAHGNPNYYGWVEWKAELRWNNVHAQ